VSDAEDAVRARFTEESVYEIFDAVERRDNDAVEQSISTFAHEDCRFEAAGSAIEGIYEGWDAIGQFFSDLMDAFELSYDNRTAEWVGDTIMVSYTQRMTSRTSGIELEYPACYIARVEADKVKTAKTVRGAKEAEIAIERVRNAHA
jgi:SnoaL-like domain